MERIGMCRAALVALAVVGFAGPVAAQSCVDPPHGMISWWTGDGDTADVVSGFDANLVAAAGFAPGMVGDAFVLDGVTAPQDAQVVLGHVAVNGLADLTVEMWVNTTDDDGAIFSGANADEPGGNELVLIQRPNGLRAIVNSSGSGDLPVSLSDGTWHHLAFVREGDMGRVYVDGVLIDSRAYPLGTLGVGPGGLMLGQEQDCLGGCFSTAQALDGMVDEVTVYGRALSDAELLSIVDAGSAGKCKPEMTMPGPVDEDTLVRVEDLELDVDDLVARVADLETAVAELQAQSVPGDVGGDDEGQDEQCERHPWRRHWRGHRH